LNYYNYEFSYKYQEKQGEVR